MEKFSNWRDKGTGIAPFWPTQYPRVGAKLPLQVVLFVLKLPFFLLLLPFVLLGATASKHLCLKYLFNFGYVLPATKNGDFVIVNYSSPLLIFLLSSVVLIPDQEGTLYSYSPIQLLQHALGSDVKGTEVVELSKFTKSVVFCLIEGTPTNNKSVLKFIKLNSKYSLESFNLKTLIVKINPAYFNLPLPSSALKFFYNLLINSPSSISLKLVSHIRFDVDLSKAAFRNANLHTVNFSVSDKQEFYDYYLQKI
ncbi:hypothetical protein PSN45_002250 [Yamadazyma tenuis]|uniref:Uncharacterized protein n=1 Tax=Candida tenuis (strain ATCC 10573 / BCRC 21748 / CBS 615 / JCM 9827 / NBRC 10315 / NRRL Y-1498 / VKM Y-70) TaxID=590646 RepID=G3BFB3_CANTC|nr:uncharacterized protein CANTEDRAFT_116034 [Yamadazyma tenuis ATCC 10573]EGV60018.1 hypothetical protein CANTEDRAFT_116034 [Yamadazyma tenuis ATCC 10573]WEJ94755.1 hypothetical protein PSN45_002250 [Yamadazyma tenuis]